MVEVLTKDRLEETAMELCRRNGSFTLEELAEEHGATLHQILDVVGSEERMIEGLKDYNGASILIDCRLAVNSDEPVPERVYGLLHALVDSHADLVPFPARPGRTDCLRRECRRLLRDLLLEGIVDHSLTCGDPDQAADLALDAIERFHTWGTSRRSRHTIERAMTPAEDDADSWAAMVENEAAFSRLWVVLRPALGIQDVTGAEMRVARDVALKMRELRSGHAA